MILLRFVLSCFAALAFSNLTLLAQRHDHAAMVGGNITITGNAIPDQLIARPMLLYMIPQAGDNDAATQFKVAARASLGVPDEQLTPILNEWYATYNLFNDRSLLSQLAAEPTSDS